jgi:ribonuclease HI
VRLVLYADGAARGNPGPAGAGAVLYDDKGKVVAELAHPLGHATNNVAEYSALVEGLRKAAELHLNELEVVSDSELVVNQMRGSWKVKNEALRELWREAMRLATTFDKITYNAVRREHNELADRLVNEALDAEGP